MRKKQNLMAFYQLVRATTVALCKPLSIEDYVIQSINDVSPPKWHLAHTSWFFEVFILMKCATYKPFDIDFTHRFNSYYQKIGSPYPRAKRGLLSRPTLETINAYRAYVDMHMAEFINSDTEELHACWDAIVLGLNHEQQHQELLLMDIKYNFSIDPNFPVYWKTDKKKTNSAQPLVFFETEGGLIDIGHKDDTFCLDNELPKHQQFLSPYKIANRLITNGEYLAFIQADGYQKPEYWLYEGWEARQQLGWSAPLYWYPRTQTSWDTFTLMGLQALDLNEPVSHISFYEADAFARWQGARLPTEAEWEHFAWLTNESIEGNFLEKQIFHPQPSLSADRLGQLYGDVWEWTSSPYVPYPGFEPLAGPLGEYNGKFMCNQFVLRGGSCITPQSHMRATYRNYYPADKRWQFSGIRLAKNL